ncbi:MAG: protein-glutamate O-methyltransferase, partial [Pseudomonadota bacterium]
MSSAAHIQPDMSAEAFEAFARIAHGNWGLVLVPEKRAMVASRLRHRVRACGLDGFDAYQELVQSEAGSDELANMISALTTNVSHFFREPHHFDILSKEVLPRAKRTLAEKGRFRIWSAGCSNGQEPYSIAMHLLNEAPELASSDFKILATDIDPKVISFAKTGAYDEALLRGLPGAYRKRFTTPIKGGASISKELRGLITFNRLNLLEPWPMTGAFDAIFCRNVVIYFDQPTQDALWPRFNAALVPTGMLFLGHSERIQGFEDFGFSPSGATAFKKSGTMAPHLSERNDNGV